MLKILSVLLLTSALTACAVTQLNPAAAHVQFTADPVLPAGCEYRGEVIGSEGHWYTYLFIANETLMQGALNDLRNEATAKDANMVYLENPHEFGASVTLLGIAYHCKMRK